VDRIDASAARDHIEMVDRILAESHQRLCAGGELFVVWGFVSSYITVLANLVHQGSVPRAALWTVPVILGCAVLYSIARGRSTQRVVRRSSIVQREFFNVLWLTLGLALVADLGAYNIFGGIAGAAVWSVAESVVLLYIGLHGNRRAQIAGVLVVVSLIAANFFPAAQSAYVLAAGMLVGYAGFGVAELLARD
jgi:hypothetical protein